MTKLSAGLLPFRRANGGIEVFLVHPGGPFWKKKDLGAWSLHKGEYDAAEEPLAAALREFAEETGFQAGGPGFLLRAVLPVAFHADGVSGSTGKARCYPGHDARGR